MPRKKKLPKTVPCKGYLAEIHQPLPEGEKCEHTSSGWWVVKWGDKLYTLDPNTQLQKDIWLGDAKRRIGEEAALGALRWVCCECGTVQKP